MQLPRARHGVVRGEEPFRLAVDEGAVCFQAGGALGGPHLEVDPLDVALVRF